MITRQPSQLFSAPLSATAGCVDAVGWLTFVARKFAAGIESASAPDPAAT